MKMTTTAGAALKSESDTTLPEGSRKLTSGATVPKGNIVELTATMCLILRIFFDSRLGHRVLSVTAQLQRRRPVLGQLIDSWRELVAASQHVLIRHDLPGVRCHAAHRGDQAGDGAALGFVVRLVVANCSQ